MECCTAVPRRHSTALVDPPSGDPKRLYWNKNSNPTRASSVPIGTKPEKKSVRSMDVLYGQVNTDADAARRSSGVDLGGQLRRVLPLVETFRSLYVYAGAPSYDGST